MITENLTLTFDSLSDLLRDTPTTPKFKTSFLNSPSDSGSHSEEFETGTPRSSALVDNNSNNGTSNNIIKTNLNIPKNINSYRSKLVDPLRLPKKFTNRQSKTPASNSATPQPPQQNNMIPPPVKPYVNCAAQSSTRMNKTLHGGSCCFCEEPLEYIMSGEKVVGLSCGHVSHFQCLAELMDIGSKKLENSGLPICPNCDQLARPLDDTIYNDMVKSKLLDKRPTTPSPKTEAVLSHQVFTSPQSQNTTDTNVTDQSRSSSVYSSPQTTTSPASSFGYENSHTKKNSHEPIVESPPMPEENSPVISIDSEVDEISPSSSREQFARFLISVSIPDNIYSKNRFRSSLADIDIKTRIAKRLKYKVKDWRHLEFSNFGKLRLCDKFLTSRDQESWQEMTCYLFENVVLLAREYDNAGSTAIYIKASIDIKRDIRSIFVNNFSNERALNLKLEDNSNMMMIVPYEYFGNPESNNNTVENWYSCFMDPTIELPVIETPGGMVKTSSPSPSLSYSTRPPLDMVVAIPTCGLPQEHKFECIRETLTKMLNQMGPIDRLSIVLYSNGQSYATPLKHPHWNEWQETIRRVRGIGHGEKNDIAEALKSTVKVFDSSSTDNENPIKTLYLIGDSSNITSRTNSSFSDLISEIAVRGIIVHSFGCTVTHTPDPLVRASSNPGPSTTGTYFYVREWKELESCALGRLTADKSYTHRNVEVCLTPKDEVDITSINGGEASVCGDILDKYDGSTENEGEDDYTTLSAHFNLKKIHVGNMCEGQTKSILVQVSLPPKPILLNRTRSEVIDLFDVNASFKGFRGDTMRWVTNTGVITLNLDGTMEPPITPLDTSSFENPPPSATGSDFPPSPLYGDIVFANEMVLNAPMFLAVQKQNIQVVRRRIQLAAAKTMELAMNHVQARDVNSAHRVLMDSRPLMKGLTETSSTDPLYKEVKAMTDVLDKEIEAVSYAVLKPLAFENDVRKRMIQMIGVLKSQMGLTSRSSMESLFLQQKNVF